MLYTQKKTGTNLNSINHLSEGLVRNRVFCISLHGLVNCLALWWTSPLLLVNRSNSIRQLTHTIFISYPWCILLFEDAMVRSLGKLWFFHIPVTQKFALIRCEDNPQKETSFHGSEERPHTFSTPQSDSHVCHSKELSSNNRQGKVMVTWLK